MREVPYPSVTLMNVPQVQWSPRPIVSKIISSDLFPLDCNVRISSGFLSDTVRPLFPLSFPTSIKFYFKLFLQILFPKYFLFNSIRLFPGSFFLTILLSFLQNSDYKLLT